MTLDPYVYPGTGVLRNKEGITDKEQQKANERLLSNIRQEDMPFDIPMTPAGYREIHRYLLQDVYEWAGQDRTVNIARTGVFCRPERIEANMDKCFAALNAENNLRGLDASQFAVRAAEYCGDLNAIHPFREGNGRTLRAFLERLGAQAGHNIDLTRIEPAFWNHASQRSFERSNDLLAAAISGAIVSPEHQQETSQRIEPPEVERDIDDLEL